MITFKDADEARAWDGYAAAVANDPDQSVGSAALIADALLAERRKREGDAPVGPCPCPFRLSLSGASCVRGLDHVGEHATEHGTVVGKWIAE